MKYSLYNGPNFSLYHPNEYTGSGMTLTRFRNVLFISKCYPADLYIFDSFILTKWVSERWVFLF